MNEQEFCLFAIAETGFEEVEVEDNEVLHFVWSEFKYHVRKGFDTSLGYLIGKQEGGGMDEGSDAFVVFALGDKFYRKEGYYASYDGYTWDGEFYECEPKEVMITEYRRKNV